MRSSAAPAAAAAVLALLLLLDAAPARAMPRISCQGTVQFGVCGATASGLWRSFDNECFLNLYRETVDRTMAARPAQECYSRFGGRPPAQQP